jgi:hypothetical protein
MMPAAARIANAFNRFFTRFPIRFADTNRAVACSTSLISFPVQGKAFEHTADTAFILQGSRQLKTRKPAFSRIGRLPNPTLLL